MAKLTRKCQRCKIDDTHKDEMMVERVGEKKPINKFYHKHCYEEHLKEKEFKEQERVELDKLVDVIKQIYGVKSVPNNAYPFLQDLRNGTKFFGKYDYKYKEGYTYDLIAETFDYCSETIEYYNRTKNFTGFTNALRYGLAIVCDKLSIVENRRRQRERQKKAVEKHLESLNASGQDFKSNYKKPAKTKADITDFLDD